MSTNEPDISSESDDSEFKRLDELADKGELTQESLQAELNAYAAAYRQEFELATENNPDKVDENIATFAKNNLSFSLAQIAWLANNSTSDSVRLTASKYLVELAREDAKNDGDPIKDLLKELSKNKSSSEEVNNV